MKISEKQLLALFKIVESILSKGVYKNFPELEEGLKSLIKEIYEQQSDKLIEVKDE